MSPYLPPEKVDVDGERIIVLLDRQFVVYPGGAGVDEGAGVEDIYTGKSLFYTGLFYTGTSIA